MPARGMYGGRVLRKAAGRTCGYVAGFYCVAMVSEREQSRPLPTEPLESGIVGRGLDPST